jgi:hypothetical protein
LNDDFQKDHLPTGWNQIDELEKLNPTPPKSNATTLLRCVETNGYPAHSP